MQEESILKTWRPYVLIFITAFLIYLKTLSFGFVDYDDKHLIVTNHQFLSNFSNIFHVFSKDVFDVEFFHSSKSYYRPLLTISLMIDAQYGGTSPFFYHLTNIIVHAATSCLLFLFLIKIGFRKNLSLFFSIIFAVHPALTQAVAWIPGRNDSLLTFFAILSFIYLINLLEKKKWRHYFLHIFFFLTALFAKETALALTIIFLSYIYLIKKIKLSFVDKSRLIFGWSLVISSWLFLRSHAVENPDVTLAHTIKSIMINFPGIIQYAGKTLFPVNLSTYPIMKDVPIIYGVAGIIIIISILFLSKNKRINYIIFGLIWFIIFLLPSLISSRPGAYTIFLEHRLHLPIIGMIIILTETNLINKLNFDKKGHLAISAVIICTLSLITFHHSNAMRDPLSFWANAASTSPNSSIAHLNLGDKYYSRRLIDKAEAEFRKALELNPEQPMAHNNLGMVFAVKRMFTKAENEFKTELEINPGYENALYNLGMLKFEQGNIKEAIYFWQKTLKVNPHNIKANRYLAYYFYNQKDFKKAMYHINNLLKRGVKINPDHFSELNLK